MFLLYEVSTFMAEPNIGKLRFVLVSGLKWGLTVWLIMMLCRVAYEYITGNPPFAADNLAYAFFFLLFCFGWGCVLGLLMWRKAGRSD